MFQEDSQSLAQEAFRYQRAVFERQFRNFLESKTTPLRGRQYEAVQTMKILSAICDTLNAEQGNV
jgi:hypothetical protein